MELTAFIIIVILAISVFLLGMISGAAIKSLTKYGVIKKSQEIYELCTDQDTCDKCPFYEYYGKKEGYQCRLDSKPKYWYAPNEVD